MRLCGFQKAAASILLLPLQWFEIANRWESSLHNDKGDIHENTPFLIHPHSLKKNSKNCKSSWAVAICFCQNSEGRKKEKKKKKDSIWTCQEKLRLKYKQSLWSPATCLIFIPLSLHDMISFSFSSKSPQDPLAGGLDAISVSGCTLHKCLF